MNAQVKKLIKKIRCFNEKLAEYINTSGEKYLPSVDSTVISLDDVDYWTIKEFKTKIKVTDCDGDKYDVANEYDAEEVEEVLRYDKRRLAKAWRVWKAENPDLELERDDDSEDDD